ncbi:uncharacterized protein [Tenebrio molitor]|uniref:uncharacterized protein n=1 Tax=Tenebrio molitor TaxID=7067 RepID=UPI00362476E3
MKALHIRGMYALTERDEVVKAIESKVGTLENKTFRLSELRPNANDMLAVTLVINEEDAQKIIKDGWIRVGIARCSVEERIRLYQCYRCWKYDHVGAKCTEGDKRNLCRKCGEEGHRENGCKNEEYCIQCNRPGHKPYHDALEITPEEMKREAAKIKSKKAPGPDGIPPKIVKVTCTSTPDKVRKVKDGKGGAYSKTE